MGDQQCHQQDQSSSPAPVWNLLDRRDPAWKALYSLYSPDGDHGRAAGLQYSLQNRQDMRERVAARAAATAAAAAAERVAEQQSPKTSPKRKVAVPHFRRQEDAPTDPLAGVPRRRPGQLIKAAMESEAQQAWGQVPLPSGRLIDEQEKQRCALLMQFKGHIPHTTGLTPAGRARVAAVQARSSVHITSRSGSSTGADCPGTGSSSTNSSSTVNVEVVAGRLAGRRADLQQRFEEVEQELAERQEFVGCMQQLGSLQQEQLAAVRAEAAAKVAEMRQLDGQIRHLDGQLRELYSQDA